MARMVPKVLPPHVLNDPKRSGEVKVFDALARTLSNEYHVFYSVEWTAPRQDDGAKLGEADFVVVHRQKGLLVIEVKGGRVACRDGKWTSTDRDGNKHSLHRDPFEQAKDSRFVLEDKLPSLAHWGGVYVLHGHAVVFPDCGRSAEIAAPHIVPEIMSFAEDLDQLDRRIEGAFGYWRGKSGPKMELTVERMESLRRFFKPRFELQLSPEALFRDAEEAIMQATDEQMYILDCISHNRRALIPGVAGSGKTVLAVERALRFADEGLRTLLTCFNRALAEDLRARIGERPNLTIRTYHHYCLELAEKAGVQGRPMPKEAGDLNRWYKEDHPEWLAEALRVLPEERFDAIVVDEGQDFQLGWWVTLTESLSDPDNGPFYVFHDPAQAIFEQSSLPTELPQFIALRKNLRNARPIGTLVQSLLASEMDLSGPQGPDVEWHVVESEKDAKRTIRDIVHRVQSDMGLAAGDIAVLTTHSPEKCGLGAEGMIGNVAVTRDASDSKKVLLATAHSFKGLERPAIILAGIDGEVEEEKKRQVLYVGMSRARYFLAIVGSKDALTRLRHQLGERVSVA